MMCIPSQESGNRTGGSEDAEEKADPPGVAECIGSIRNFSSVLSAGIRFLLKSHLVLRN